jgi:hypothetical protein
MRINKQAASCGPRVDNAGAFGLPLNEKRSHLRTLATLLCVASVLGCTSNHSKSVEYSPPAKQETRSSASVTKLASSSTPIEVPPSNEPHDWFHDMTAETGIDFQHQTGTSAEKPFPAANGSGLASFDYDLDGLVDLYFATGTPIPLDPHRRRPVNRMFRSLGKWRFQDITDQTGLGFNGYSAGLVVGDVDNDGFSDVYVIGYNGNCFFHNCGDGTFERSEKQVGLASDRWGTSGAFFDLDQDGALDLYVCNYGVWSLDTNLWCGDRERNVRLYCSPNTVHPEVDILYRNLGDGKFADVTVDYKIESVSPGRGQGVVAADLNDDGWIDLYIANDLNPNTLLMNDRGTAFRDISEQSSAAYDYRGASQAGMGVDASDVDGDETFDLFVTNFEGEHNTLYRNVGREIFQDVSFAKGLGADSVPWIGWGTAVSDFDLDGWPDVVVTNGHVDDNRHLLGSGGSFEQPSLLWKNHSGRFVLVGKEAGSYFRRRHPGRSLVTSDLDNDGDDDIVIGHQDASPAVLSNNCNTHPGARPTITLRLIGTVSNRSAIGALIRLRGKTRNVVRQVKGGGSYLAASDLRQVFSMFAIAADEPPPTFEIRWPNQIRTTLTDLKPGQRYIIIEPSASNVAPRVLIEVTANQH